MCICISDSNFKFNLFFPLHLLLWFYCYSFISPAPLRSLFTVNSSSGIDSLHGRYVRSKQGRLEMLYNCWTPQSLQYFYHPGYGRVSSWFWGLPRGQGPACHSTSVLVMYCCLINHPQIKWLETTFIYFPHESVVWTGFFCMALAGVA